MTIQEKDKDILRHIIAHCDRVNEDVERFGDTFEQFEADKAFRDSVNMNIFQIGELSNSLSKEFKESTKEEIPWRQIYNMRNHYAHGYGSMNNTIIWNTVVSEIPALRAFCERQLNSFEQGQGLFNITQVEAPKAPQTVEEKERKPLNERLSEVRSAGEDTLAKTQSQHLTKKATHDDDSLG